MGCCFIIIFFMILVGVCTCVAGEVGNGGSNSRRGNNNEPLNEVLVKKLVNFIRVGLAVVSESHDSAYMHVIFQSNNILIMFNSDGVELWDSIFRGARNGGREFSQEYQIGEEFHCTVGEYKVWRNMVQLTQEGRMSDINIAIPVGTNNKYFERVKEELGKLYSPEEFSKIPFSNNSINYMHSKY